MNNFNYPKVIAMSIIAGSVLLSSCKKEDVEPEPPAPTSPSEVNISGSTWTSIHPTFVANERIMGLTTYQGKLLASYMNFSGNLYLSGHLSGGQISQHSQSSFGSGSGFEKVEKIDGTLYGIGIFDSYCVWKFDANYFNSSSGNPWSTQWSSGTNQTGLTKIGSEFVGSFGIAPYVRSQSGGGNYPDFTGAGVVTVNEVINYNGELVVAGKFVSYNGTVLNNVARWDGSTWQALGDGVDGEIIDLAVLDGKLIVGGKFTETGDGNTDCRYIASWNGSSWESLGTGLVGGFNGVRKLHVYGSQLFVGGDFTSAGSVSSPNIIKWKSNSWSALAGGVSGGATAAVGEIVVFDGHLYIANAFSSSGSNYLLKLE